DPHVGLDPHERRKPEGLTGRVHDRKIERIVRLLARAEPVGEYCRVGKWTVSHIGPEVTMARERLPQVGTMTRRVEAFEAAVATAQRDRLRESSRPRIDTKTDRLTGVWVSVGQR